MGQYERAQQVYGDAVARSKSRQPRDPNGDMPLDSFTKGKIANLHAAVADGDEDAEVIRRMRFAQ